jgi:hypothetical protein
MQDTTQYPPISQDKYPHMFPLDKAVWERFIAKYGPMYLGFQYDVTCGITSSEYGKLADPYKKDATILSKLRIDAVGEAPSTMDIIEVKPKGNMAAIGQLLTYKQHYTNDYKPVKPVRMVLVCENIDPNIIQLAEDNGIVYIVV